GGEGDGARRRRTALADDLLDLIADGFERDAERLEGLGGDALTLVDEAEQDVLGADVVVVEEPCLLLGQNDDPPGTIREAFEQETASLDGVWCPYSTGACLPSNRVATQRIPRRPPVKWGGNPASAYR